jgi:hypothetical protein
MSDPLFSKEWFRNLGRDQRHEWYLSAFWLPLSENSQGVVVGEELLSWTHYGAGGTCAVELGLYRVHLLRM